MAMKIAMIGAGSIGFTRKLMHDIVVLLKQAMLHDPLVGAVCNPEEVWQMTDEMLVAQAKWLPQYSDEIPRAQRRLEEAVRNGTRVKLRETRGAARLHTKSVEEMARNADHGDPHSVSS